MTAIEQLVQQLESAKGDTQAQAVVTAEFLISARPEQERESLREALNAAAVLRWFDAALLAQVLEISPDEAKQRFETLKHLPFVESFQNPTREMRNVHESTRLGWRKQLARIAPKHFRLLSGKAAAHFETYLTPAGRIEWIYHLICADPQRAAAELEKLNREWSSTAHPQDRYALAAALQELKEFEHVADQVRVWILLVIGWTDMSRSKTVGLERLARHGLKLALSLSDMPAEAQAQTLIGKVLQAQGKLGEAHAAFAKALKISQKLALQDSSNAGWQRDLAAAHNNVGDVLKGQGKLGEAHPAFAKALEISQKLASQDPSNAGWQRGLAVAHCKMGELLQAQRKLEDAQAVFAKFLEISQKLVSQDLSNARWQRDLAVAHCKVGELLQAQRKLEDAQAVFAKYLEISQKLALQDPSNAGWQRDLAVAHDKVGELLEAQGKLEEAQTAFAKDLEISQKLALQDPSNAGWQRDMAVAHSKAGNVLQARGRLAEAQAAFAKVLEISQKLALQDPSNADWQRDLKIANLQVVRLQAISGDQKKK